MNKKLFTGLSLVLVISVMVLMIFSTTIFAAENLVKNGDFENGNADNWGNWSDGILSAQNTDVKTGSYSGQIDGMGSISQVVTGLSPNTDYVFTLNAKLGTSSNAAVGVKEYGGEDLDSYITDTWETYTFEFTTGAANSAHVFLYNAGNTGTAFIDDVVVSLKVATDDPSGDDSNPTTADAGTLSFIILGLTGGVASIIARKRQLK